MSDDRPVIEALLRQATGDPAPSPAVTHAGRNRLQAAMRAEPGADSARRRSGPRWRRAVVVGVALAVLLMVSVLVPGEVSALAGLAEVAETVAPTVGTEGRYVYLVTDQVSLASLARADLGLEGGGDVAYLRTTRIRTWETEDRIRQEVIVGAAVFFDPLAEAAYLASPLAAAEPEGTTGSTDTARIPSDLDARAWPTSPDALRQAMEAFVSNEPDTAPEELRLMALAGSLLRDPRIDSALRAAVFRVLDDIDGIEVADDGDRVTATLRYHAEPGGSTLFALAFDRRAHLVRETTVWVDGHAGLGVPPGTAVVDNQYSVPRVVDGIG